MQLGGGHIVVSLPFEKPWHKKILANRTLKVLPQTTEHNQWPFLHGNHLGNL